MLRYLTAVQNFCHFQRGNVSKLASPAKINWRTNILLFPPLAAITKSGKYLSGGEFDSLARPQMDDRSRTITHFLPGRPSVQQSKCLVIRGTRSWSISGANRGITRDFRRASHPPLAEAAVSFTRCHRLNYFTREGGDLTRDVHGESLR